MYGQRARIGYTSPPPATEVFPYEFYRIVPDGVTLVLTTLAIVELDADEVSTGYDISLRAARQLAHTGIDVMVHGGVPINLSRGIDNAAKPIGETEKDIGVPVTTSITAQLDALKTLDAGNIACIHPFESGSPDSEYDRLFGDYLGANGYDMVGIAGAGRPAIDLGRIPAETPLGLARDLKAAHPEADTLYFPCPHGRSPTSSSRSRTSSASPSSRRCKRSCGTRSVVAASFVGQRNASPVIDMRCRVNGDRGRRPRNTKAR